MVGHAVTGAKTTPLSAYLVSPIRFVPTREAALAARQAVLDAPAEQSTAQAWAVARWLRYWLTLVEPNLRPSTLHAYRDHIDRYLISLLGRRTLADLTSQRLQDSFNLLARRRTRAGAPLSPATVDRIRAPSARP